MLGQCNFTELDSYSHERLDFPPELKANAETSLVSRHGFIANPDH
jgi:hypothetical protein